jgi:uncharacterized protein YdhG (YjbR/CyaY superfamily)
VKPARASVASIDAYIAAYPADVQALLQSVRRTITQAAPGASERISYGIPTFTLRGNLVHFAAFKQHIGLYPGAAAIASFKADLRAYRSSKGAVQFPLDQPLPLQLIERIVRHRVEQDQRPSKFESKG